MLLLRPILPRSGACLQVGPGTPLLKKKSLRFIPVKLPPRGSPSLWRRTLAMKGGEVKRESGGDVVQPFELEQLTQEKPPSSSSSNRGASLARINSSINRLTKWIVLVAVVGVVVWKHDDAVLWAGIGAVLNSGNSKLLKRIIKQERPLSALHLKADPGMPSSHAQSLGFVASYAAIGYLSLQGLHPGAIAVASGILLLASYMAWLRVAEGLHTPAQVIVGVVVGSLMAGLWLGIWLYTVKTLVSSQQWARYCLDGACALAGVLFFIFGVREWRIRDL